MDQNQSKLIGLDGRRIEPEAVLRIPVVEYQGLAFPMRVVDGDKAFEKSPKTAFQGLLIQNSDQLQLMLLGMTALAKDIYTRQPEGSRNFLEFAESLGIILNDVDGKQLDVVKYLKGASIVVPDEAPTTGNSTGIPVTAEPTVTVSV